MTAEEILQAKSPRTYQEGTDVSSEELNPSSPKISEKAEESTEEFALTTHGRPLFLTLAVLSLIVSLDGTSISVAIPVR